MSLTSPIIAIIGAGAVGGYYGARLAQHGHSVHFLLRSDYETVRKSGLRIQSCDGDFSIPADKIHVYREAGDMPPADLVVITLKATANDQYQPLIAPLLKNDTALLTLQNGLGNEERLAELFGASRVLGGMAFTCINRIAPGHIHHLDHGQIRLGEFGGGPSPRARRIAEIFNSSKIACQVLDDLRFGRWEKLVWNIPFNGLGAALDLTTDRLLASADGISLVRTLMQEVIAAANALGIPLNPEIIEQKIEHTRTMGAYLSSMQVDRRMNRPMEIEAIIGRPLSEAKRVRVTTPCLEMVYRMLKALDNSRNGSQKS
ncbi:MAG TPA: putative 2-dehydropantoate 2-reductase [Tepidisphaeraceae bacterium]|jgi:2-dehydropantoate 2-reductase